MNNILPIDIETIPAQLPSVREDLGAPIVAEYARREEMLKAELAGIRPPANLKDPAKIAAWEENDRPRKEAEVKVKLDALAGQREGEIDAAWRKTSFDGALGQIVVIGYAFNDAKPFTIYEPDPKKCLTLAAEASVLRKFFAALEKVPESQKHALQVVGHNVVDFDLRFIWQRAVIHGIRPPHWMPWHSKPWGDRVFDTMVAWAGVKNRISLDKLCRVLGIAGKGSEIGDEIDGSKVWDFVKDGRIADVATYCGADVERAREVYSRLTFAGTA